MSVTINAKGTSVSSFTVGKAGTNISQSGTITPPIGNDLIIAVGEGNTLIVDSGDTGPALITASNDQDLHINPATGGGQFLILNANRWPVADGTANQILKTDGNGILSFSNTGAGSVTSVSVATANGFAGTVESPDADPVITIETTVTGIIKGDGAAISSATSGTDYSAGTSALATGILKSTTSTGALSIAVPADFPTLNQNTTGSAATLTTARNISTTGDASWTVSFNGSADATAGLTLATVNSNTGSFGNASSVSTFTVNGKGLITAAANTSIAIAASQTTSGTFADARISQSSVTQYQANLSIAETQIPNGSLLARNADNETITGNWTFNNPVVGADPTIASNFTTKQYVDNALLGLTWKTPVLVATTTNITLSGTQTIDGVAVVAGNRVLVKNQSTQANNGIYVVAAGSWTRSTDFDQVTPVDEINGAAVFVTTGTTQADTGWTETATVVTVGTDPITFVQFSAAGAYVAGAGMSLTGNTFNVGTASSARIVVNVDDIDLATVTDSGTGTFLKLTRDSYGRLSGTTAVVASDITGLVNSTYVAKAGDTMTGALTINPAVSNKLILGNSSIAGNLIHILGSLATVDIGTTSNGIEFTTPNSQPFIWTNNATEKMRLDASGKLGIGTTPGGFLHVKGTGTATVSSGAMQLLLQDTGANNSRFGMAATQTASTFITGGSSTNPPFVWATNDGTIEQMRIDSNGNVGINTAAPLDYLTIGGPTSGRGIAWANGTSDNYANIFAPSSSGGLVMAVGLQGNTSSDAYVSSTSLASTARNAIRLNLGGTSGIQFFTDIASTVSRGTAITPTERLRIDNNGNMGLNGAPYASWGSIYKSLDIGGAGGASFWGTSSTTPTSIQSLNSTFNGTNWVRTATGSAGAHQMVGGDHVFFSDASAAAGTFTPTERLRIKSTGVTQVTGDLTATGRITPGLVYTNTVSISGLSANTFYQMIPNGTLASGAMYTITMRWDHVSSGGFFIVATTFNVFPVSTNNTGTDPSFLPMCSSHVGSAGQFTVRTNAAGTSTSGLQAAFNWTGDGNIVINAYRII